MRKVLTIAILGLVVALALTLTGCGQSGNTGNKDTLDEAGIDALAEQVAADSFDFAYKDFMTDEGYAVIEVFDEERDGDDGKAYVHLDTGEFVVFKDKAYLVSGSSGEAIITFTYGEKPTLKDIEWSADGSDHEKWLEDNFTAKAKEANEKFLASDETAMTDLYKKAEEGLNVKVETEDLFIADLEAGTYELIKVIESGETAEDYTFDTETLETGKLADLK
jgi:hypothetical protein